MSKISINLLPQEVILMEKDLRQRSFKIRVCIVVLSLFIVISLGLIALRLIQSQQISQAEKKLTGVASLVKEQEEKEKIIVFLKERLSNIVKLNSIPSPQSESYALISSLAPQNVILSAIAIDKAGKVGLNGVSSSTQDLKLFLDNLVDPQKNQGRLTQVNLEVLGKGVGNSYRFDLNLAYK